MSTENWAEEIGRPAYESIVDMVLALECDFDRLEGLRDERDDWDDAHNGEARDWIATYPDEADELQTLTEEAGDCENREDAEQRIQEDPLEIQVRSDWHTPGGETEAPSEFYILLSTGGPAVRIRGELNQYGEPDRAWLEVQDWGKPWTQYFPADQDTLLSYARCFYYGE